MPHVSLPMVQLWWFQTKKQVSEEWVSRALTVLFAAWGGPPKSKPWRKHWEPGGQILQRPSFAIWDFRTQGSGYLDFQKILLLLNTFVQQFFFFFFYNHTCGIWEFPGQFKSELQLPAYARARATATQIGATSVTYTPVWGNTRSSSPEWGQGSNPHPHGYKLGL